MAVTSPRVLLDAITTRRSRCKIFHLACNERNVESKGADGYRAALISRNKSSLSGFSCVASRLHDGGEAVPSEMSRFDDLLLWKLKSLFNIPLRPIKHGPGVANDFVHQPGNGKACGQLYPGRLHSAPYGLKVPWSSVSAPCPSSSNTISQDDFR
jgi:hypothetical protein